MSGLAATLRVREFRALLLSYVINRCGDVVGALALAVVVFGMTRSAVATSVLFLATQFLPGLLGPVLVAHVDRVAAGRLLAALYVVEGSLFLLLALIVSDAAVAVVVALAFFDALLAFCARTVTRAAAASTLLPRDLMPEGKAAFNIALAAATMAGPLVGGVAVATVGAPAALLIDAVSFLLAAAMIARSPGLAAVRDPAVAAPGRARQRLRDSIVYVGRRPALRRLIAGEGMAFVFFYLVVPVTVVYAARSLHAGAGGYAAMLASWGAGMAAGSLLHVRLARRIGTLMILASTMAVAVAYLATAAAATLLFACVASVVGGIGNGTQWASVETAIHQLVEEAFRARVAAVVEALAAMAPGVGILLGGTLTAMFSPRAAYLVAGIGLVVLVGAGYATAGGRMPAEYWSVES